ncbi:putative type II secretion system protein E [Methanocella conradii HZ254]|uniref:Type II secretion system protein E n=1 Tax=Methanocella conradii (strain DSM 24694 / JCM 17849 / CGMCC 1.5162 / HZ254) TaxID=1041930 RepID=H8I5S1_METCZ|nr:type II/IV secretion system ATPase subunit [Methanocella conradii]AFC99738.1 putative type II secretion system protein E [Methanocella conradii HZ254]
MDDAGGTALKEMPESEKTRASIESAMKLIENAGGNGPASKPIASTALRGEATEVERYWVYEPYSYVSITYDDKGMEYKYNVCEPEMTESELEILERVYDDLRDLLIRGDIEDAGKKEAILKKAYDSLLNMYGLKLSKASYDNIYYYLVRNYIGYGRIDALMRDGNIEDISCNGIGTPVFLFHRRFQNIKTNIAFDDEQELNTMVTLLVQRGGRHISLAEPISNATLPDGSRIEATLGREVTTRGSSFTIRKFRADPFTPVDLIKNNTMSSDILAYLWLAIENNKSLLFAGGTASGKTSSLNAVSLFIPQGSKVITIEDTRELTLFHSNWLASVTREGPLKQQGGEIDMYELLRAALRQRPEYIIVGEVRGREALTLFQAMNTGHTTYSTMHAGSIQAVVNRLLNDPINVPNMMLQALNIVSIQELLEVGGKKMRRVKSIVEITGIDPRTNNLRVNELFRWDSAHDTYERLGDSYVLGSIMEKLGWDRNRLSREIKYRVEILNYLAHEDIRDYRSIGIVIHAYRMMPEKVMELLRKGGLADILQAARR